jgi:redox-sensing transcriptional repressor
MDLENNQPQIASPVLVKRRISDSTIYRLSKYYHLLSKLAKDGSKTISSKELANLLRLTPAQVRKDLSFFGAFGTRGLGYSVAELAKQIGEIIGLNRRWKVAVVGVGNIGSALVGFKEFPNKGFDVKLVFDNDQRKIGSKHKGMVVSDIRNMKAKLQEEQIELVVLAVPAGVAQEICDQVVAAGVKGILSFAPIHLDTPDDVFVRNEDMAMEMEYLTYALVNRT